MRLWVGVAQNLRDIQRPSRLIVAMYGQTIVVILRQPVDERRRAVVANKEVAARKAVTSLSKRSVAKCAFTSFES